jgi:orotate phosphoribosyltransferase
MLPQALADDYIDDYTLASLVEWRKNPAEWPK